MQQLHGICSISALTLTDFELNNLTDTNRYPPDFGRNRSKTFSYKTPWITTLPPRFSKLPTTSQPISPENDGKWISQKTACIYQLSISLMLFL